MMKGTGMENSQDSQQHAEADKRALGQVIERAGKSGPSYAIRFRAYGSRHYVTLGARADGWTRARAETELENVLADVRRGIWKPVVAEVPEPPKVDPSFHEFASEWFEARKYEWRESTRLDYKWQLSNHLLPFFARHRLTAITVAEVDRYREFKVREGALSAESINKTITRLGQILDVADERELIPRNPVRVNPKNRKLRATTPERTYIDRAVHLTALLDAAGELDRKARVDRQGIGRRAVLATLALGGLRIGELCALRRRDVDLTVPCLHIRDAKTAAGVRVVQMVPGLVDELSNHLANRPDSDLDDFVFATASGKPRDKDNVRNRVLLPAVKQANAQLVEDDEAPLPDGLTLHSLRRTFASILIALGEDPAYVMDQIGHTDAHLTLRLYAKAMRRGNDEKDALRVLVTGADWAQLGTNTDFGSDRSSSEITASGPDCDSNAENDDGRGWFRTSDLSRVRRALSR